MKYNQLFLLIKQAAFMSTIEKQAKPKWFQMLMQGKLGPLSESTLAKTITKPRTWNILGGGAEGLAMRGFYPGHGESTIKFFNPKHLPLQRGLSRFMKSKMLSPAQKQVLPKFYDVKQVGNMPAVVREYMKGGRPTSAETTKLKHLLRDTPLQDIRPQNIKLTTAGPKLFDPLYFPRSNALFNRMSKYFEEVLPYPGKLGRYT